MVGTRESNKLPYFLLNGFRSTFTHLLGISSINVLSCLMGPSITTQLHSDLESNDCKYCSFFLPIKQWRNCDTVLSRKPGLVASQPSLHSDWVCWVFNGVGGMFELKNYTPVDWLVWFRDKQFALITKFLSFASFVKHRPSKNKNQCVVP